MQTDCTPLFSSIQLCKNTLWITPQFTSSTRGHPTVTFCTVPVNKRGKIEDTRREKGCFVSSLTKSCWSSEAKLWRIYRENARTENAGVLLYWSLKSPDLWFLSRFSCIALFRMSKHVLWKALRQQYVHCSGHEGVFPCLCVCLKHDSGFDRKNRKHRVVTSRTLFDCSIRTSGSLCPVKPLLPAPVCAQRCSSLIHGVAKLIMWEERQNRGRNWILRDPKGDLCWER